MTEQTIRLDLTPHEAQVVMAALMFMATFEPAQMQPVAMTLWSRLLSLTLGLNPSHGKVRL